MRFKDIIGSQEAKAYLQHILAASSIPHAQLLAGSQGGTALSLALAFVSYLHCRNKQEQDMCTKCDACKKMAKLMHPDLIWVFPTESKNATKKRKEQENILHTWSSFVLQNPYAGINDWALTLGSENKRLQIGREQVENMQNLLGRKPFESNYKTFLVWLPEYCNAVAANAMLKIVEEPRPATVFVFISERPHQILPTLKSRMFQLHVPPLTDQEVIKKLQLTYPAIDAERIQEAAQIAQGNLNEAVKIINGEVENYFESFASWLRGTYRHHWPTVVDTVEAFHTYTPTIQQNWLAYAIQMIRATIHIHLGNQLVQVLSPEAFTFCTRLAKTITLAQLEKIAEQLMKLQQVLQRNAYARLAFLSTSLRVASVFRAI